MSKFVVVTFWDGTEHRCEVMHDTDIYIATLQALSDLARKGTFKNMNDVKDVSFDILSDKAKFS